MCALDASSKILLTEFESFTSVNSSADFSKASKWLSLSDKMQFYCLITSDTFGEKQTYSSQSAFLNFVFISSRLKNSTVLIFLIKLSFANSSCVTCLLLSLSALSSC
jgi:hypothetical protein